MFARPLQFVVAGWAILSLFVQVGVAQGPVPAEPVDFVTPAAELIISPTRYAWGVVLAPDKSWVAVGYGHWGNEAGRVCVFDVASGKLLWSAREMRGVRGLAVSPDGTLVASGNFGGEIHFRDSKTGQLKKSLQEPSGSVEKLTFSSDGRRLATGSNADLAHIWDLASGQIVHSLVGHTGRVYWVDFSPDGKLLLTGSQDKTVRLWDATDGKLKQTWQHPHEVSAAVFLPDGKQVASVCHDGLIRLHNVDTGQLDRTLGNALARIIGALAPARQAAYSIAVSADGSTLAAGVGAQLEVWALPEGKLVTTLPGHNNIAFGVSLSKDGKTLASAGWDSVVKIWDVPNQQELLALKLPPDAHDSQGPIRVFAMSADGTRIAAASAVSDIELRDRKTGAILKTLSGHKEEVVAAAFSPDGKWLATAGADQKVLIWNAASGQLHKTLSNHTDAVNAVAWSADGKWLATASNDQSVALCSATTFEPAAKLTGHGAAIQALAFSPDSKRLYSGGDDAVVQVWDVEKRSAVGKLAGHSATIRALAAAPDNITLASGGDDGAIQLWNVATQQPRLKLAGHPMGGVRKLTFSPRGQTLASGGADNIVRLWDPATGQMRKQLGAHTGQVTGVAFLPDAAGVVTAGLDRAVRLWKADEPRVQPVATHPAHAPEAYCAAFSADGKWLATGGKNSLIALRDPATGAVIKALKGHNGIIYDVSFSPDQLLLASAASDGTVRMWSLARGEEILKYNGYGQAFAGIRRVAFSPDGKWLASGAGDGTLKLFDVDGGKVRQTLTGQALIVTGIQFTPDSQLMATCTGNWQQPMLPGELRLWEVASGRELTRLDGHPTEIKRIAMTADGKRLISSGSDRTVIVWDVAERKVLSTFKTEGAATAIALLPDGQRLVVGDGRGGVSLWDLSTGKLLKRYAGHTKVIPGIATSPSGKLIASTSQDGTLKLWAVP